MSSKQRSRKLFVRADGGPMVFSLVPCSERKEIRELIEHGGAVLLQPEVSAVIQLVPCSVTVTGSTDDVFSANYIRACSDKDTLFRLADFKIPVDSNARRPRTVRGRRNYTFGEEILIARYIANKPGARIHGSAVYKEMVAVGAVPGRHSWRSLKQHYLKKILPFKHLYESPNAVNLLFKRRLLEVATELDSLAVLRAASHVLVEDSVCDIDSRKPRSIPRNGLGVEGVSTYVVPETESSSVLQSSEMSVVSKNLRKSKRTKKIVSSASPSPTRPEEASKKSSVPEDTREQLILNKLQTLLSLGDRKKPAPRRSMRSGSRITGVGRPTCAVVSKGQCSSDAIGKQRTPVEQHRRSPVKPDGATLQECSSSHSGQELFPQSSENRILGDAAKHASASSRTMPLRRSQRKRPNTTPQKLTDNHSSLVLPAASHVLVEDSAYEQDSQKPRSPPKNGLGVEGTSSYVVLETESSSLLQSSELSVISKNLRKSKRAKEIVSSASPSPTRPEEASKSSVPVPEDTREQLILKKQQALQSSLGDHKKPAPRRNMRSGSRITGVGRPTCAVVSKGQCSSDVIGKQQTPVEQHRQSPVKSDGATLQECSSNHSGQELFAQSSENSILVDAVKHASASSRTMPLRRSQRKLPNKTPQALTDNHSDSQLCSKPGVGVRPSKGKQNSHSPRQFRATDKSATAGLLESTPPLGRRGITRSSLRKQQSAELQKDSSSQSFILHCSEPSSYTTAVSDLEHQLAPLQTGRRLLPCTSVADRRKKKGISLRSEVASNSVPTEEHKSNTSPRKQQKAKGEHGNASCQSTSPLITPSDETASSDLTSSTGTSAGKRTRSRCSLLQELQGKSGSGASKAKTERKGKKAPKGILKRQTSRRSPSPPQHSEDGRPSSACQDAGTGEIRTLKLSTGVEQVEILDSADEDLLTEALGQEVAFSRSPRPTPDVAEGRPAMATGEIQGRDVSEADSEASTVSIQSAITISSDSADEDSTPKSEEDDISKARQMLVTLLGVLRAGQNMEPHSRCPADCCCPRSAQYIQAARAVVSLSAFLAYHDQPLPSESPGIEDANTALLLEILLRRLEVSSEKEQGSSDSA